MSILKRKVMPRQDLPSKGGSVMAAYDIMKRARRKKSSLTTEGYEDSQIKLESPEDEPREEPKSLQDEMVHSHQSDEEDRGKNLFDGMAERIDPLKKEMRENQSSEHLGRTDLEDDDSAAEDIVSRIMRKMKRK